MQNSNDHKKIIQKGFDTVAAGYDHPSLSFFPETAKRLVEYLQLNPTDHLLDVCTGTGCVALTAAEKLIQDKATGIDLSSGMLQQAKDKAAVQNLNNTTFQQVDLEELSLQNNFYSDSNAGKLREISIIVGCAVRTKIPASKNFHGAHGAPYTGKHS